MEISAPGSHFRWFFGDIVSDDSDKGGSGDTDAPDLLEFENFFGRPFQWHRAGGVANRLQRHHLLQHRFGKRSRHCPWDELQKAAYLGEAKFLRAYWYFNLVTTFGEVPLVDEDLGTQ